jgi:hypothetical protein
MTALAADVALVPIALGMSKRGSEIQAPMAIAIFFGLLTSTALNMMVVPTAYYRFGARSVASLVRIFRSVDRVFGGFPPERSRSLRPDCALSHGTGTGLFGLKWENCSLPCEVNRTPRSALRDEMRKPNEKLHRKMARFGLPGLRKC